ncbi:hypothetical protein [Glaciimonas sp. PCH181]|uniref:hypothetical protein n=1 Tax=Glaciimonas sp. PCH181 TaxID=2133943 RepID=UPI000D3B938E|nr:hypothetical protein [Glaciimonas sp. PCH181]PUA18211.1 hypothetical protein C7W93_20620 [Glaciimonas sp. PCH181]
MHEAAGPGEVINRFKQVSITPVGPLVFHLTYALLQLLRKRNSGQSAMGGLVRALLRGLAYY